MNHPTRKKSYSSILTLLKQSLRVDFSSKERIITPIFFAAIILLLFSFAIPEQDPSMRSRMMVAEMQLAIFFALQISFVRSFESERTDRIFDYLRLSPVNSTAFLIAKTLHVLIVGACTVAFTGILAVILQGQDLALLTDTVVLAIAGLTLLGLTGLGVLLASITLKAEGQNILFPLLYFPLSVPVLLCSTEFLVLWLEKKSWDSTLQGWVTMLIAFDVIYVTLTMLFGTNSVE